MQQVGAKLSWRAITRLIDKTENLEEYLWYSQQSIENGWSSTVLVHQIESKLYETNALAEQATYFKNNLLSPLGEQAEEIIKDKKICQRLRISVLHILQ